MTETSTDEMISKLGDYMEQEEGLDDQECFLVSYFLMKRYEQRIKDELDEGETFEEEKDDEDEPDEEPEQDDDEDEPEPKSKPKLKKKSKGLIRRPKIIVKNRLGGI